MRRKDWVERAFLFLWPREKDALPFAEITNGNPPNFKPLNTTGQEVLANPLSIDG
ncbi:hypothetical protein [Heyndrickxia coagulans]|uniref:Uncharacterized protein n=1 Tax=Heyndrickxia coagulans TaxID=1398 RepID=A0A150JUZ8_HEYCO|nr:hypothetical protein [Heyndrickxia coagulans]KYC61047.1 hypothetical protein B4098_3450 [Heyndrickxia coagulans]